MPHVTEAQHAIHRRILSTVKSSRLRHVQPRAAAKQVLGVRFCYKGESTTVVTYDETLVSLPSGMKPAVPLCDVLAEPIKRLLTPDKILADDVIGCHGDSKKRLWCYTLIKRRKQIHMPCRTSSLD